MGSGSGSGMGGITGGLAGLAIDEGSRYEDRKSVVRVETDTGVKKPEDYIYYRRVDYWFSWFRVCALITCLCISIRVAVEVNIVMN